MQKNCCNLAILFFTMDVAMMGFGMIIPILRFFIIEFGAGGSAIGILIATYAIMQFIFSPIWGGGSDRSQTCLDDRRDRQYIDAIAVRFFDRIVDAECGPSSSRQPFLSHSPLGNGKHGWQYIRTRPRWGNGYYQLIKINGCLQWGL